MTLFFQQPGVWEVPAKVTPGLSLPGPPGRDGSGPVARATTTVNAQPRPRGRGARTCTAARSAHPSWPAGAGLKVIAPA